jgi:penicillin-binding protein 1C
LHGGATSAERRIAEAASVHLVVDILADNAARSRTFGRASSLATRGFAAVKTGTSKDLRDNWCIGFTDRYTVGVWIGNASGEAMHEVSGVSGAAPIWHELVGALQAGRPSRAPARPAGVVSRRIVFEADREPARDELFVAGTEQAKLHGTAQLDVRRAFGITSPRDGSRFALDPDIPPAAQQILFEGERGVWWLNGRRVGQGSTVRWAPWPGRHELELRDARGRVVHSVRFEVRGAALKSTAAARSGG